MPSMAKNVKYAIILCCGKINVKEAKPTTMILSLPYVYLCILSMQVCVMCLCTCKWVHAVDVCVCLCEQKVHQPINRNSRLSTFPELEICHPQEKPSVWFWLISSGYLCQQYSSLFPACGWLLIFGSFEAEKRGSTSVSVLTSALRGLSGGLCSLVSQLCTHRDCK